MHELGIILSLADTLKETARENHVSGIVSVTLGIGEVSGVVPEYLTDCWQYFRKKDPLFAGADLKIETLPAVTFCRSCHGTYETVRYGRACPLCGSEDTFLLKGTELIIHEIEAVSEEGD
ncbi:MAG: hydrogenase maturation nickel metallochaperone HypA [Lachnospiraceae bacterium]|jgi:hydrogenase nickel incorporation protein HypA/HybF|nr:hydrogenase maturation nickel metallochaperone HypA [Lachnospiraceae bacterium]